jgi:hypothetical protein
VTLPPPETRVNRRVDRSPLAPVDIFQCPMEHS